MRVALAESQEAVRRCYPVMAQLRPHLSEAAFLELVSRMMRDTTFRIAYLEDGGEVQAVAGFRIMETLVSGRHMYVDDLVTKDEHRSQGLGSALFEWLEEHARSHGCKELQLDSGVQRHDAHRFYFRKGMFISSYHFRMKLGS